MESKEEKLFIETIEKKFGDSLGDQLEKEGVSLDHFLNVCDSSSLKSIMKINPENKTVESLSPMKYFDGTIKHDVLGQGKYKVYGWEKHTTEYALKKLVIDRFVVKNISPVKLKHGFKICSTPNKERPSIIIDEEKKHLVYLGV